MTVSLITLDCRAGFLYPTWTLARARAVSIRDLRVVDAGSLPRTQQTRLKAGDVVKVRRIQFCPCGSGHKFGVCCQI